MGKIRSRLQTHEIISGGAGGITARGQIYRGAPIGVVEIHLQLEIAAPVKVPPEAADPSHTHLCSATDTNYSV